MPSVDAPREALPEGGTLKDGRPIPETLILSHPESRGQTPAFPRVMRALDAGPETIGLLNTAFTLPGLVLVPLLFLFLGGAALTDAPPAPGPGGR